MVTPFFFRHPAPDYISILYAKHVHIISDKNFRVTSLKLSKSCWKSQWKIILFPCFSGTLPLPTLVFCLLSMCRKQASKKLIRPKPVILPLQITLNLDFMVSYHMSVVINLFIERKRILHVKVVWNVRIVLKCIWNWWYIVIDFPMTVLQLGKREKLTKFQPDNVIFLTRHIQHKCYSKLCFSFTLFF